MRFLGGCTLVLDCSCCLFPLFSPPDKRPVAAVFLHAHMDLNGMKKDVDLGCEHVSRGYSRLTRNIMQDLT